jgi:hypothetical protein
VPISASPGQIQSAVDSGPGEGFGIKVGLGDKAVDGGLKIDNASKDTSL